MKTVQKAWASAAVTLLLAGCAPAALDQAAAERLQGGVLAVTEAASDGKYRAALAELDRLSDELDTATADGSVTFARHQQIRSAMERVRVQLLASLGTAAPTPDPTPTRTRSPKPTEPVEPAEPLPEPLEEIGGQDDSDSSGQDPSTGGGTDGGPPDHAGGPGGSSGGPGSDPGSKGKNKDG